MKNKLLCLLMCALMISSTLLVGCGKANTNTEITEESNRTAVSINLWIITDDKSTDEAKDAVEKEFNSLTKSTYTTNVDIIYLTAAEYMTTLNAKFDEIKALEEQDKEEAKRLKEEQASMKAAGITVTTAKETETEQTEEATVKNEYGVSELKYPEITDRQVDIILVKGAKDLATLVEAGYLSRLDDEISSTGASKKLNDYINTMFIKNTKVNGGTYAIPNNQVIGEYTYLFVNKTLAEKYYYSIDKLDSIAACEKFVEDVKKNEADYAPILQSYESPSLKYWSNDGEFSVLSTKLLDDLSIGQSDKSNPRFAIFNTFSNIAYVNTAVQMKKYETNGYFSADAENETKFGIAVLSGDYALRNKFDKEVNTAVTDEYVVKVLKVPYADDDVLYESMFAVSSYTKDLTRSMEIITAINTDSKLRNVLQYGVEGVNYELDDDGNLKRLNNNYIMDLADTGNAFMAYPEEGMALDAWKNGKLQNADAILSPFAGLSAVWDKVNPATVEAIEKVSAEYYERIQAAATAEELEALLAELKTEILANTDYLAATSLASEDSYTAVYGAWYDSHKDWASE